MGNTQLAIQSNRNVSAANKQRVTAQTQWQSKIGKVIEHLEQTEMLTTCKAIADALNKRGLKTVNLPFLLGCSIVFGCYDMVKNVFVASPPETFF